MLAHVAGRARVDAHLIQDAWANIQQLPPPWHPNPVAESAATSTVIEFGELGEDDSPVPMQPTQYPAAAVREHDTCVAQNDSPYQESELDSEVLETKEIQSDTVVINPAFAEGILEWVSCGSVNLSEELEVHVEPDPFAENFDEDVVVIDRFAARSLDGLRDRTRVSCAEGRELAATLSLIQSLATSPELKTSCSHSTCLPAGNPNGQSFEFSTLQDLPEIDLLGEFQDELTAISPGTEEQIELEFDEAADCVPLPWTRGSLGDDRDIIIVEEDLPQIGVDAGLESLAGGARRTEFRDLFAQLRRVST
jgi:hypothetical protein